MVDESTKEANESDNNIEALDDNFSSNSLNNQMVEPEIQYTKIIFNSIINLWSIIAYLFTFLAYLDYQVKNPDELVISKLFIAFVLFFIGLCRQQLNNKKSVFSHVKYILLGISTFMIIDVFLYLQRWIHYHGNQIDEEGSIATSILGSSIFIIVAFSISHSLLIQHRLPNSRNKLSLENGFKRFLGFTVIIGVCYWLIVLSEGTLTLFILFGAIIYGFYYYRENLKTLNLSKYKIELMTFVASIPILITIILMLILANHPAVDIIYHSRWKLFFELTFITAPFWVASFINLLTMSHRWWVDILYKILTLFGSFIIIAPFFASIGG